MSFKRPLLHLSISVVAASVAFSPTVSWAQNIVSAHSGTVHYFDGAVSVDGEALHAKTGRFSELKEQQVLKTTQGRAEVLLTPGVFLRVGENSEIKMLDNRLASTRVELLSGSVAVESDDPQMSTKDSPVTLIYKDYDIHMVKYGLLEVSAEPALMRVYKGEAIVTAAGSRATVKDGHQLPFSAALLTEKFNDKVGDDLYLWSRDRSQSLSAASMSSARSLNSGLAGYGFSSGGIGYGGVNGWNSNWFYNSSLGMFTFVPGGDMFLNAFGYGFFSPYTIYNYYTPTNYWYGGAAGMVGRPVNGVSTSTTAAAPLSTLRGGASANTGGVPALGAPMRGGGVVTATGGGRNADFGGNFGGIPAAGPSGATSAGSFGGSRGGGFSGGGGGGAVAAAPAATGGGGGGGAVGGLAGGGGARGR